MPPNRKSTIDQLDPRIKDAVNAAVRENRSTIDEIVTMIASMGGDASRSAVGRYVKNHADQLKKFREAQEVAKVWCDKMTSEPDGDVAQLLSQMMKTVAFSTLSNMDEADPEELMLLSTALKNVAQADKLAVDRLAAVRKLVAMQALKAAEEVTKTVRKAGMSDETVELIRSKILGIGEAVAAPKAAA